MFVWIVGLFILLLFIFLLDALYVETTDFKPEDYPSLSDKEMGHLRSAIKLADQLPGDWSYMGEKEPGQEHMEAYRYQLAFMTYFLALVQYHKTPAYREIYQRATDKFIQKMLRKDAGSYWPEVSKKGKIYDPDLKEFGPGWVDHIKDQNIMYSGHLLPMLSIYKMLYRDMKYDAPGSLTFVWDWIRAVRQKFEYGHKSIAEIIYEQFMENSYHSICCEVNVVFPEWNQHPILGLMLYDHDYLTNYSVTGRV